MDRKKVAQELVAVAKLLTSGRINPDINDVYSAVSRMKRELESGSTLGNAVEQFASSETKRIYKDLSRRIDDLMDAFSKDWDKE